MSFFGLYQRYSHSVLFKVLAQNLRKSTKEIVSQNCPHKTLPKQIHWDTRLLWVFPGFGNRFAASVTPDTENACCHVSALERSQTFWQQRAFIKKKKKKQQFWSRIKKVSSYCLNLHLHWLLSTGRRKSQRLMLPFPSRKYGILCSPIRVTHRSSIILKRLQSLKWLFCWK